MLDFYFTYPKVLRRLRDGALGNEMERIAAHFSDLSRKTRDRRRFIILCRCLSLHIRADPQDTAKQA